MTLERHPDFASLPGWAMIKGAKVEMAMRMRPVVSAIGGLALALGVGTAMADVAPAPMASAPAKGGGYLGDTAPDTYRIIPPAPAAGSIRDQADRATFLATRVQKDSPRWALAINDVDLNVAKAMSCAAGVELNPKTVPKLFALIQKMAPDISRATNHPKDIYKRMRPYLVDEGPICVDKSPMLGLSPDYPSGHVTYGWTVGLILAELAPDRATEILIRARAYGESRMICGVHTMSAVESGRTNASALVAGLHGSAAFRSDLEGVRAELNQARAAGPAPAPAACAAEAELTKGSPYN